MANHDYIPSSYTTLVAWLINLVNITRLNIDRFRIIASRLDEFAAIVADFAEVNAAAEGPEASKSAKMSRRRQVKIVKKEVRQFVNANLRYNSALTADDRIALGLSMPVQHVASDTFLTVKPTFKIDTSCIRRVKLSFSDSERKRQGKPAGACSCEIHWVVSDKILTDPESLIRSELSLQSKYTFVFDDKDRGKFLCFRICWANMRGEKGPWSDMGNAVIT